jgi:hypothetical protein
MIINIVWEFDLRYLANKGELKNFGIDFLKDYDELHDKDKRKVYENFADKNNIPLSLDLSRYWREPEYAYEEDITEFLKDKWGYPVKSWDKEWCIEDHIEDHMDFVL